MSEMTDALREAVLSYQRAHEAVQNNPRMLLSDARSHEACAASMRELAIARGVMFAAALAAPQADGWQPIEAAPKDGSDVLLSLVPRYGARVRVTLPGFWVGDFWVTFNHDGAVARAQPTHWMPLPEPPAAEREPGRGG